MLWKDIMNKFNRDFGLNALQEATAAAIAATELHLIRVGGDQYPCGFAWVNIKPARGPWVALLKDIGMGYTDEYAGGYTIWNPSSNHCQNMDAKEAGARAFADELGRHGLQVSVGSRMD